MRRSHAAVVLLCLGLLNLHSAVADGFVGCLFRKSLCQPETEWCFDDYAFGRCTARYATEDDLYRFDLKGETLQVLKREVERLLNLGYPWNHLYTQCVLQRLLNAFRYESSYDHDSCSSWADLNTALKVLEGDVEQYLDPQMVAHVKFTPSIVDPHAEYADEVYVPLFASDGLRDDEEDARQSSTLLSKLSSYEKKKRSRSHQYEQYELPEGDSDLEVGPQEVEYLKALSKEDEPQTKIHFTERYNTPDSFRLGLESRDYQEDVYPAVLSDLLEQWEKNPSSFSQNYNTPDKFRDGIESKDKINYNPNQNRVYYLQRQNSYLSPEDRELVYENYKGDDNYGDERKDEDGDLERIYTEGGMVYLKDGEKSEPNEPNLKDLVDDYYNRGFKRPERLDVKKPGPAFNTNNYAFREEKSETEQHKPSILKPTPKVAPIPVNVEAAKQLEVVQVPEKKKGGGDPTSRNSKVSPTTQEPKPDQPEPFVYILLNKSLNGDLSDGQITSAIRDELGLSAQTLQDIKEKGNEIFFKVKDNNRRWNASELVKELEKKKGLFKSRHGFEILRVDLRDESSQPLVQSTWDDDQQKLWILSFLLCGVIAAIAIAGAALFVIKRHSRSRDKLQNLSQPDTEASKDYQDLCRARMATKTAQEKPESGVIGHRITNLTRESEGSNHSPSSRSSTSSWSEEPALTNMDISTGHMVLSYMEDHLKNKDRLEQEWKALCAYEAEPCATTIALKGENSKKNRYNEVLPYDHARVVLNELSNISGSDYINASTITDHDPRNPAYIATQGPLPHTAADFWQMVWEQGSVVMVMLTRLTENGSAMCHRYWPEEGSELYHIYEVHLVSEHIWCDDYLVRSFYLKNLKTGETRTVTQFHFLSWPENGVPLSTKALLEFRRKVNKSYRGRSCPIVVHCSDGVGRSGTYCLIDMVLNRMAKGAKEIDIAATLEHIRDQRPLMVRTKQQFEFVLMAVAEEVHAILKALPANHSPPPILKEKE